MKIKEISIIILYFLIIFSSLTSAQLIFKQDSAVEISHPIRNDGFINPNIVANITIKDPYNNIVGVGLMSYNPNTLEHNITFDSGNSSSIGSYDYCISAINSTAQNTECFEYDVTITGINPSTAQSVIYFFMGLLSLGVFGLSLTGAIKIKWKNKRNERGIIVGLNDLKYVKLFLWFFTYLMLIFIMFAFRHVSYIASWNLAGIWFNWMFWFLLVFLLPVFVIVFTTGIIAYLGDKKTYDLISRGFKVK